MGACTCGLPRTCTASRGATEPHNECTSWQGLAQRSRPVVKPVEELSPVTRASSIESKRILIQVIVQVFTAHSALVRPDQPALQQGSHPVNVGQQLGGRLARTGQKVVLGSCGWPVRLPRSHAPVTDVPFPAVGVDRAVGHDSLLDEGAAFLDAPRMRFNGSFPSPRRLPRRRWLPVLFSASRPRSLVRPPEVSSTSTRPRAVLGRAAPSRAAACAATPRRYGSFPDPRCFAVPVRSPRFSGWSPTTWSGCAFWKIARRHRSLIIALPTPQQAPPAGPSSPPSKHTKPCGQRSCIRYSRHACSVAKRPSRVFRGSPPRAICWSRE